MRVSFWVGTFVAAALLASGCATSGGRWGKPRTAVAEKAEQKSTDSASDKTEKDKAEKKDSPFVAERDKSAAAKAASTAKPPEAKPASEKPAVAATASPAPKKPAEPSVLSAETMKLIDEELRDASPEERIEWYAQLKRVEPSMIPEILRARRLSVQVSARAAEPAPPATTAAAAPLSDPARAAWSNPAAAPASSPVQPVAYAATGPVPSVTPAGYQAPQGSRPTVDHAVHRVDPRATETGIVLQNFESDAALPPGAPPSGPRAFAATEAQPAGVPWPPTAKPAPPTNSRSSLSFGAGFVQNVVGLVPNRGATAASNANGPAGIAIAPAGMATTDNDWRAELAQAIALLEQEIALHRPGAPTDDDLRKQVSLRLMYLMADHQERALTAIPGLEPAEQEFWQQLVWGMSNSLDTKHIARPEDRATQTVAQLNTAVRRLQERADLHVRNVTFCRQILYFGNYERFPRDEFRPGQEVLLYAEVDNFKSEPTADGQYRTLLRSSIEILSPSGEVRKQIEFPATEDLCRNYRRDYFHNYQFTIPDRLPLGPHVLKLSVFDELSGKMTSYTLNFLVN
jgi:hypothetical protein